MKNYSKIIIDLKTKADIDYQEIAEFIGVSGKTISQIVNGNIDNPQASTRAGLDELVEKYLSTTQKIPFLGKIAAGTHITYDAKEEIIVPKELIPSMTAGLIALEIEGDSMIDEHLEPGDKILALMDERPAVGDIVIAQVGAAITIKRLYGKPGELILRAGNNSSKKWKNYKQPIKLIDIKAVFLRKLRL